MRRIARLQGGKTKIQVQNDIQTDQVAEIRDEATTQDEAEIRDEAVAEIEVIRQNEAAGKRREKRRVLRKVTQMHCCSATRLDKAELFKSRTRPTSFCPGASLTI